MKIHNIYTSACSNGQENNLVSNGNSLIFSRTNAIYKIDLNEPYQQPKYLLKHDKQVKSFKFTSSQNYVISTSIDKKALIWKVEERKLLYELESPDDCEILTACSLHRGNENFISFSSSLDNNLHVWHNNQLACSLKLPYCCIDSKTHVMKFEVPSTKRIEECLLLFLAGSDNKMHTFQVDESGHLPTIVHLMDITGHSDWIKCIEILELRSRNNELLVATASLDSYIRVWHLKALAESPANGETQQRNKRTLISNKFKTIDLRLMATLETVLSGHDGAVNSICWFKKPLQQDDLQLISCSGDKTIVIWTGKLSCETNGDLEQGVSVGVWKDSFRFGEILETNVPFLGVSLSESEDGKRTTFYAQSLRGAIHSWDWSKEDEKWVPKRTISGHFQPVTDLSWEANGSYLLSVSLDKTCRLHSLIKSENPFWAELARPLVHGYEINSVVSTDFDKFVIGADEMSIRFYGVTKFFLKNFISLTRANGDELQKAQTLLSDNMLPKHGQLSVLGLSVRGGKFPYDIEDNSNDKNGISNIAESSQLMKVMAQIDQLNEPPTEDILLQSTLWWETNKLFGHGNEIYAMDFAKKGEILASASKANRVDVARIFIWDTTKSRKLVAIEHHTLTITRLRFSPSNKYLLSVSRDRTWCLSMRNDSSRNPYVKLRGTVKSNAIHERIIWDCAWTWDETYFITVSRDKKAILWATESTEFEPIESKVYDESIQAVDSLPYDHPKISSNGYLFALGFQSGLICIELVNLSSESDKWTTLATFELLHHMGIKRLIFKPQLEEDVVLASAAEDCIVNITSIKL